MITNIGLVIIVLAWLYQLVKVATDDRKLQPFFLGMYISGVFLLTYDAFLMGDDVLALLNLLAFAMAIGILFILFKGARNSSI